MKAGSDLVRGWLRKASSDAVPMDASLNAGALDAACFHAQQAAEKWLKAYLIHREKDFPYTHNLSKLVEICAGWDESFRSLMPLAASLTPYAVELRYDHEFWPVRQATLEARSAALAVKELVLKRLPEELIQGLD